MVNLIYGGQADQDLLEEIPGPVCMSRWLTTANRFMRVYVSKHRLAGDDKKNLDLIVEQVVLDYYFLRFRIKCQPSTLAAPGHVFAEMVIVRDVLSESIREIVKPKVNDGAWYAHSEHLLLHLLSCDDEEKRHFAVRKILQIRGNSEFGDTSVRPFKTPELNWLATKIEEMISWENATEPIYTAVLSADQIRAFLDSPFQMKPFPCHTQAVERMVKEVSCASANVFGAERRDGYVRARLQARKIIPKPSKKSDLAAIFK